MPAFNAMRSAAARLRGGPLRLPAWVPTTAWQAVDIPNTTWTSAIRDDGNGIAPQITTLDPGVTRSYLAVWQFSGPTYSPSRHEFWMFGGGHAATTINILTRTNLDFTPTVNMACAPSTEAIRRQRALTEYQTYLAQGPYFPDGKPYSPHSYSNNIYLPTVDTFVSFALRFIASSGDGVNMSAGAQDYSCIAAFQREATNWRPKNYYTDIPSGGDERGGPRVLSADGSSVFWWHTTGGLRKWNSMTNVHSSIGGTASRPFETQGSVTCNNGADTSFHIRRDTLPGMQVKTCDLTTGIQTTVTVSGYSVPTGVVAYGVVYVPTTNRYISVWVDSTAWNNAAGTIASFLVVEIELVTATTATATLKTVTGSLPTKCGSITGMGYDPAYGCVVLNMDPSQPIKAIKVT